MRTGEQIGLGLLLVGTLAGLWSAFNPSYFTIKKFALREGSEQDREDLQAGFKLFGATSAAVLVGTYLLFYSNSRRRTT